MTDKEFSKLDPIVPESDERIGRGRAGSSKQAGVGSTGSRKSEKPHYSNSSASKAGAPGVKSIGLIWKFLVLILMCGLGGLGYFFIEQTERLSQLQGRFDELEAKIVSTDESLNESGTALAVKLKDQGETLDKHWSEIKKLWGVSHDRNRKKIEAQEKTLAAQSKTVKNLQASMSARKKEITTLTGKVDKASQSMETVVNSSLAANLEMNDLVGQSQQINDQVNNLEKSFESLKQNLNTRVADNEEAINAIDAYRLQVNRDIQLLKQQLAPASSGSSTTAP
jgi:uncharacterized coiled-coil protein SlyX